MLHYVNQRACVQIQMVFVTAVLGVSAGSTGIWFAVRNVPFSCTDEEYMTNQIAHWAIPIFNCTNDYKWYGGGRGGKLHRLIGEGWQRNE